MAEKVIVNGVKEDTRQSTQNLLSEIYSAVENGVTEIDVNACGQHDIGGPLWNKDGSPSFLCQKPGQRVGSMGMSGTTIVVEGSATADTGWLNAGAEIIVKGNSGDTTAHCAATGKIYIGGSTGTRSGALMKYDPKFSPPEFWVLKNTGSFSFEFMSGGIAIVCGYNCEDMESVLGYRSCVGMVGGTVYVRGNVKDLSDDVWLMDIDDNDWDFLDTNLPIFLKKIQRPGALGKLSKREQWKKSFQKHMKKETVSDLISIKDYREK